ncbi:MAG: hypothetical protein HYY04_12240 [Chloroflexi bacterium]|nr:hypothetical protein [Chloroflexota bacterium]
MIAASGIVTDIGDAVSVRVRAACANGNQLAPADGAGIAALAASTPMLATLPTDAIIPSTASRQRVGRALRFA